MDFGTGDASNFFSLGDEHLTALTAGYSTVIEATFALEPLVPFIA